MQPSNIQVQLPLSENRKKNVKIPQSTIISSFQMLLKGEYNTLFNDADVCISLRKHPKTEHYVCNITSNNYSVDVDLSNEQELTLPNNMQTPSVTRLIRFLKRQQVPEYNQCKHMINNLHIQQTFLTGNTCQQTLNRSNVNKSGVSDIFLKDNASTISKLTDLLNNTQRVSYKHTAKLLALGVLFATTSEHNKSTLFNVSQLNITHNVDDLITNIYNQPVEKHYVTMLLRGNSQNERICRINVNVRIFPPGHEIIEKIESLGTNLNSSIQSGMMILTGVHDNQFAAIYFDTYSNDSNCLNYALNRFF